MGVVRSVCFSKLQNAPLKIFYVGRDTYYWKEIELMLDAFDNGNLESYLWENASAVDLETRLNWGNGSGAFWSFVNKLHLYIRTGQIQDLNDLTEEDKAILQEVGYGNVNCMELDDTLFYPNMYLHFLIMFCNEKILCYTQKI